MELRLYSLEGDIITSHEDGDAPLDLRDVCISVGNRVLFTDLNLSVGRGQSVAVLGPSGCGKSTLLASILGLVKPDSGSVSIVGNRMDRLKGDRLASARSSHIGMVFQFGELIPELTPVENIMLPAQLSNRSGSETDDRAHELLDEFGVDSTADTDELSGGERQRVAVARALTNRPTVVLADEPTGALDEENRERVADFLFDVPRQHDCVLIVVTHDRHVAQRADRILSIKNGALVNAAVGEGR